MANDGRPRHADGTTDERYRIMPEWCGEATRQLVVRFCGDWVGHAATMADAYAIAQAHADKRREAIARIGRPQ